MVCKATHCFLRLIGKGATSLPGVLALKICPDILSRAAAKVNVIAVTGTNGKTTSARMTEKALQCAGKSVFANRSGANLISGITAEFILNLRLSGGVKCDWAVIECDEAACRRVLAEIRPRVLLVTNLFRDQLDRYGTVTTPRDSIAAGLRATPDTIACLNADCPMAASIAAQIQNKTVYFGMADGRKSRPESGEDGTCPICGSEMRYSYVSYANLGAFRCKCGFARHDCDVSVRSVLDDGSFVLDIAGCGGTLCRAALPGLYNIYNAAGMAAAVTAAGIDPKNAVDAAAGFDCGFGRMESFPLGKKGARMILIKNAAAADQTLDYLRSVNEPVTVALAVNDRIADGTDISWLEDADFGKLARMKNLRRVLVTGLRADTAAERLGRENIHCEIFKSYDTIIDSLADEDAFIFILPTYTAMLDMRRKLVRRLGGKNFWE